MANVVRKAGALVLQGVARLVRNTPSRPPGTHQRLHLRCRDLHLRTPTKGPLPALGGGCPTLQKVPLQVELRVVARPAVEQAIPAPPPVLAVWLATPRRRHRSHPMTPLRLVARLPPQHKAPVPFRQQPAGGPCAATAASPTTRFRGGCSRRTSRRKRLAAGRAPACFREPSARRIGSGASGNTSRGAGGTKPRPQHLVLGGHTTGPVRPRAAMRAMPLLRGEGARASHRQQIMLVQPGEGPPPPAARPRRQHARAGPPQRARSHFLQALVHGRIRRRTLHPLAASHVRPGALLAPRGLLNTQQRRILQPAPRPRRQQTVRQGQATARNRLLNARETPAPHPAQPRGAERLATRDLGQGSFPVPQQSPESYGFRMTRARSTSSRTAHNP